MGPRYRDELEDGIGYEDGDDEFPEPEPGKGDAASALPPEEGTFEGTPERGRPSSPDQDDSDIPF